MAEGAGLLNQYTGNTVSRVRIPFSPPPVRAAAAALATLIFLAGCCPSQVKNPRPTADVRRWVSDTLYFGMSRPGGGVSEAEWKDFLAEVVTPRFPGGFTVWKAEGQWRDKAGKVGREPSRVLQVLHLDGPVDEKAVQEIREGYKKRFAQESVLRVEEEGRVSF